MPSPAEFFQAKKITSITHPKKMSFSCLDCVNAAMPKDRQISFEEVRILKLNQTKSDEKTAHEATQK